MCLSVAFCVLCGRTEATRDDARLTYELAGLITCVLVGSPPFLDLETAGLKEEAILRGASTFASFATHLECDVMKESDRNEPSAPSPEGAPGDGDSDRCKTADAVRRRRLAAYLDRFSSATILVSSTTIPVSSAPLSVTGAEANASARPPTFSALIERSLSHVPEERPSLLLVADAMRDVLRRRLGAEHNGK